MHLTRGSVLTQQPLPDSGLEETPQGSTCSKTALALLRGVIPIIYTMQK